MDPDANISWFTDFLEVKNRGFFAYFLAEACYNLKISELFIIFPLDTDPGIKNVADPTDPVPNPNPKYSLSRVTFSVFMSNKDDILPCFLLGNSDEFSSFTVWK